MTAENLPISIIKTNILWYHWRYALCGGQAIQSAAIKKQQRSRVRKEKGAFAVFFSSVSPQDHKLEWGAHCRQGVETYASWPWLKESLLDRFEWDAVKSNHFRKIIMCLLLYTSGEIRLKSISLRCPPVSLWSQEECMRTFRSSDPPKKRKRIRMPLQKL